MGAPFKRTRLWINPAFQFRLMCRMGYYFLVYTLVVWLIGFFLEVLRSLYTNGLGQVPAHVYIDFLWNQQPLLVALIAATPFFVYDLMRFSHRVAGPLHRCRCLMREMVAGKPVAEFTPRKHDLMPELFEDFNALIKEWNARVAAANACSGGADGLETAKTVSPAQESRAGA